MNYIDATTITSIKTDPLTLGDQSWNRKSKTIIQGCVHSPWEVYCENGIWTSQKPRYEITTTFNSTFISLSNRCSGGSTRLESLAVPSM